MWRRGLRKSRHLHMGEGTQSKKRKIYIYRWIFKHWLQKWIPFAIVFLFHLSINIQKSKGNGWIETNFYTQQVLTGEKEKTIHKFFNIVNKTIAKWWTKYKQFFHKSFDFQSLLNKWEKGLLETSDSNDHYHKIFM